VYPPPHVKADVREPLTSQSICAPVLTPASLANMDDAQTPPLEQWHFSGARYMPGTGAAVKLILTYVQTEPFSV
jgi:hypothetical protein